MYPIVWEPFGFPISSFGVMLAIGFLVGTWITAVRMREEGLDPEAATTILIYVMIGGVAGSALFAIDNAAYRRPVRAASLRETASPGMAA